VIGNATLYLGDCRDILPTLPADSVDCVVTDPVWPNCNVEMPGSDRPGDLFREFCNIVPRIASRLVVQLGCDTDPRFLRWVLPSMPFLRVCWLEYACPTYKGRLLHTGDVGYVFGEWPKPGPGRMVLPGRCISSVMEHSEPRADKNKTHGPRADLPHPCARRLQHVSWLVNWFGEDSVCDPFMGSGTTGVACARLGKRFVGVEIDPGFFKLACDRIQREYDQGRLPLVCDGRGGAGEA
jgi:hypothetical protein